MARTFSISQPLEFEGLDADLDIHEWNMSLIRNDV